MLKTFLTAAAIATASAAHAEGLSIGDKMPPLGKDVTWVQGESATEFAPGKIYILDFWATWCGPCVRAIPHMDEIADTHAKDGVTVIGVAIWPRDNMRPTAEFVKEKGDAMSYPIAADIDGKSAARFMEATGSDGIPTCMIVDRTGRLAWIGHPLVGMDDALAQIIDGSYDISAAALGFSKKREVEAKAEPLMKDIRAAHSAGDWKRFLASVDRLVALDDEQFGYLTIEKFKVMLEKMDDPAGAYAYAKEMVNGPWGQNAYALNAFAWAVVETKATKNDWDLVLQASQNAVSMTGEHDANLLDTLAAVHAKRGDFAQAVEIQTKAVALVEGEDAADFKKRLAEYEAGAKKPH